MEDRSRDAVTVHVDPSCPFAWITSRWLAEVERAGLIDLELRLLSLSVVNEHRAIDAWYQGFNYHAWAPARVMQAVDEAHGATAARRFYEAFGQRFHVERDTGDDADRVALAAVALHDTGLPATLIEAADDARRDDALRARTHAAVEAVGLDVGVPLTEIGGVTSWGPVLSVIPRGDDAVELYRAAQVIARQRGFIRFERPRLGALEVG
ncbi:MAG: disulfide bond formation protein DsbA [Actinobacteria bacterium]|nr:disulfide bond formation protein DsbA [Actinomycetota bacterium]